MKLKGVTVDNFFFSNLNTEKGTLEVGALIFRFFRNSLKFNLLQNSMQQQLRVEYIFPNHSSS